MRINLIKKGEHLDYKDHMERVRSYTDDLVDAWREYDKMVNTPTFILNDGKAIKKEGTSSVKESLVAMKLHDAMMKYLDLLDKEAIKIINKSLNKKQ